MERGVFGGWGGEGWDVNVHERDVAREGARDRGEERGERRAPPAVQPSGVEF